MPAFDKVSYDPLIHALIGSDDRIADCLIPVFTAIRSGARPLSRSALAKHVYWTEACGFILYVTISRDGRYAEVSGYAVAQTLEP
jgi:hypothetical protein